MMIIIWFSFLCAGFLLAYGFTQRHRGRVTRALRRVGREGRRGSIELLRARAAQMHASIRQLETRVSPSHLAQMHSDALACDLGADILEALIHDAPVDTAATKHIAALENTLAWQQHELRALAEADRDAKSVQRLLDGATAEIEFILNAATAWAEEIIEQNELQQRIRVFVARLRSRPAGARETES